MIKLINLLREQVQESPKAIFVTGSPGSGKSFISKQLIPSSIHVINSDDEYEKLLHSSGLGTKVKDFDGEKLSQSAKLQSQARKTTQDKYHSLKSKLENIVLDTVGESVKIVEEKKRELEELGYKTFMVMTYSSPKTSLKRNSERDRNLLPQVVLRAWNNVYKNINDFKRLFNDNFVVINNDMDNTEDEFNPEEISKQFFTQTYKGKDKSPEELEKANKAKEELNKNIKYLLQNKPEFDSINTAKQKINNFLK